tara:strand:+ start:1630 stop:2466 length:837 start_codon:yes stop_codon:yes gene_type:complete
MRTADQLTDTLHKWVIEYLSDYSYLPAKQHLQPNLYRIILTLLFFSGFTFVFFWGFSFARLGHTSKLIFLAEGVSILLISPVLSNKTALFLAEDKFLSMRQKWKFLLLSIGKQQIAIWIAIGFSFICWSTISNYKSIVTPIPLTVLLYIHLVLSIFVVIGSVSGLWSHTILGSLKSVYSIQLAILWWLCIVLSPFILVPLDRFSFSLESVIPYFLYMNPMIAICQLLEQDTSIFRTPYLYEILPVASYHFVYPNWVFICIVQVLLSVLMLIFSFRFKL